MKLAIFGATGRTGQHLVKQALDAGHQVSILARNPSKLNLNHPNLTAIQGDIQDPACVDQAIANADAVLSVLGPTENKPGRRVTEGTRHILSAMKNQGVRRLVVSTGAGVTDPNDAPKTVHKFINFLVKRLSRHVYEDMVNVVEVVRASDVDWTIVRVPMLTDDPGTGKVTAAYVGKGMGMRISREDMARFILDQASSTDYLHQAPAISN